MCQYAERYRRETRIWEGIIGLLDALLEAARRGGCRRLWLITTNDNLNALRFYQRRGWRLVAVHAGAVDEARKVKPQISVIGEDGIPIHDEIELEFPIAAQTHLHADER